jgi:XRE family aerobic/anaerobic benzoate catabolism transcriptional regulator
LSPEAFLTALGRNLRALRIARGLSQEELARLAHLSPRYVSQIEAGRGNVSILRLLDLTQALGAPIQEIFRVAGRHAIVALVGLRGAGKSTVGRAVGLALERPFLELDGLIEDEAGLRLDEIFALHGEDYYRRLEREILREFLRKNALAVIATGGGVVTDPSTYELLRASALTIWLKARPELHLERVVAQGDRRPIAGRSDPLAELRVLLRNREPLYRRAAIAIDTSELSADEVVNEVVRRVREIEGLG